MSYIGNTPFTAAFLTDTFSGNGSTVAFTMTVAPANTSSILVAVTGVVQDPSTYSVSGTTLTFSAAPPSGTSNISVRYLGIPASGVTTTAYRTQTEFTATAGQTTFTVPSYTVGYIDVYRNGLLLGSTDFTATTGTTVVLANAASAGDFIEAVSFYVSSVLNAIPATAGSVGTTYIANGVTVNFADGSASTPSITNDGDTNTGIFFPAADTIAFAEGGVEAMRLDASGNLCVGSTSTRGVYKLDIRNDNSIALGGNATYFGTIGYSAATGLMSLAAESGGGINFLSGSTERARIDSSGNLLVGTTSTAGSERLNITGSVANQLVRFYNSNASPSGIVNQFTGAAPNNTGNEFLLCYDNAGGATLRMSVRSNGGIANYSANNVNLSDRREKINFAPAKSYLDVICSIPVQTYNYIDQNMEEDDGLTLGVVAQDVQAVAPELVTESNWGTQEEPKMRLSIYQTDLQYALMKCIQEQQALIASQSEIITQLQADVAALKGQA